MLCSLNLRCRGQGSCLFDDEDSREIGAQVVHHLFPNVCHTHYPAIAPIVLATCAEFGVPYKVYPSVRPLLRELCTHMTCRRRKHAAGLHCHALFVCCIRLLGGGTGSLIGERCAAQFWSALCAHFSHLKAMGSPLRIPSLATIG